MKVNLENVKTNVNLVVFGLVTMALTNLANKVAAFIILKLNENIFKNHDLADDNADYRWLEPEAYQKNCKTEIAIRTTLFIASFLGILAFVNTRGKDVSSMSFSQIFNEAPKFF